MCLKNLQCGVTPHLKLNISNFAPGEIELVERHSGLLEVPEEAKLLWSKDEQGVASASSASSRTSHSVNVLLWIISWVVLHDPVNGRNVETSCSNVCAQQNTTLRIAELEKGCCALSLFLFPLKK